MPVLISRPSSTPLPVGVPFTGSTRMRDPAPGTRVKGRVLYTPQAPAPGLPPTLAVHACGTSAAAHAHGVSAPLPGGGLGGALALCDQESWKQRSALRRTHGDAHTFANANREWACQMAGGGVPRATSASGEGLGYYHVYRGPAAPPPTLPAPHAAPAVSHGDSVSPHSRLRASRAPLASLALARVEVAAGGHGPPQHAPPHPASSHAASASYRPDVWQRPQDVRPVSTVTPGARRAATPAHGHARQRARSAQSVQSVQSVHSLQSHPLHGSLLRRRRRSSWSSGGSCSELLPRPTTSATTTRATAAEAVGEGSGEARSDALTGAREDLRRIALWRHVD